MCYNCGCGSPGENMGDEKNITEVTFEEAAEASNQTVDEAKRNTLELLKQELEVGIGNEHASTGEENEY